jgi:hypothetical protein
MAFTIMSFFATSGKYHEAIWTSSHGQPYIWFRTTMLIAYVVIFSMFWCSDNNSLMNTFNIIMCLIAKITIYG